MLTALGQDLNKVLSRKLGADEQITKPFTVQNLRDALNQFIPAS
jgi:DNA-binding response OmpR family regulator